MLHVYDMMLKHVYHVFTATLLFIININASRDILVYYDVNDVILDFNAKLLLMVNDKATVSTVV